jgi:hypothetical protein
MSSTPGTMVKTILDRSLQFFKEPNNQERIRKECIDPLLRHILDRLFPYIVLTCILFSLIMFMSLISVGLLIVHLRQPALIVSSALSSTTAETVSEIINAVV